jgi:hypothetical protein
MYRYICFIILKHLIFKNGGSIIYSILILDDIVLVWVDSQRAIACISKTGDVILKKKLNGGLPPPRPMAWSELLLQTEPRCMRSPVATLLCSRDQRFAGGHIHEFPCDWASKLIFVASLPLLHLTLAHYKSCYRAFPVIIVTITRSVLKFAESQIAKPWEALWAR